MGKITKNYIYNVVYQVFIMLVPLVTAPYLTRVLGAEGTGTYSYVNSTATLIQTFALLGIYGYGNRQIAYVRDDPQKLASTFWQIMTTRVALSIGATVIYFFAIFIVKRYTSLFLIYYTYILAYCFDCTWLYVGVEDMKWAVIKNTLTKVFAVIGIFTLVHDEGDLSIYVGIQGCSVLASNLLAYTQLNSYVGKPRFDCSNIKKDLYGSLMLFLPSIATTIYTQCDKVMIELMTGATNEVSFYDYSEKIVTIPLTFITVLSTVMMPRIANEFKNNNKEAISSLLNKAASFSLFLAFPMMLGLVVASDKLVPWYLGDEFIPCISAIKLLAPLLITNSLMGIAGSQYFTATNQIGILLKTQVTSAVANVIINATLIPVWGFYGAAVATLITSMTCAILQYYFLLKQVSLPGLFKCIFKYGIISCIMAAVLYLISRSMNATPMTNIIQVLIGAFVYFGICFVIRDSELKYILNKVNSRIRGR